MEKILLISCLAAVGSAIFFPFFKLPNQQQSMMNVCIYSNNPARYLPKCFMCPSTVYPNVLQACVQQAVIPSNVSYTQATCIEQNCMIGRVGKRSVDLHKPYNLLEDDHSPVSVELGSHGVEKKDDNQTKPPQNKIEIIGTEEFYASENIDYVDEDLGDLD